MLQGCAVNSRAKSFELLLKKCLFFQVLIKVHACGVNPVETYIRSGTYARKPALPYTPGSDVAGVIESVGEHVTAFKVFARWAVILCCSVLLLGCAAVPAFVAYNRVISSRWDPLTGC